MSFADTNLYLPLGVNTARQLLGSAEEFTQAIDQLTPAEYSALYLISRLPELQHDPEFHPERFLASAIDIANTQIKDAGRQSYTEDMKSLLTQQQIECGFQRLAHLNIALLDDSTNKLCEYINSEGGWDFQFKEKQKQTRTQNSVTIDYNNGKIVTLTEEQSRQFRDFEAQNDEQLSIQGYTGTGKTTYTTAVLEFLKNTTAQVLVLAQTKNQLAALSAKTTLTANIHLKTFNQLATKIIPNDSTVRAHENFRRIDQSSGTISDNQLIDLLNISDTSNFTATAIIQAVRGTLFSFCHSNSDEVSGEHLPQRFNTTFDTTTSAIVCQLASDLWNMYQSPNSGKIKPQVRGFHAIKWAALNHCKIPPDYTHVLLDEAHNLSKPLMQILCSGTHALLTLGDEYQALQGHAVRPPTQIRKRELCHSVRSSIQIEKIVNPIITAFPSAQKSPFHGNSESKTIIKYYKDATVPDQQCVILVNDMWGLFEWSQKIAAKNTQFQFLSNKDDLNLFVQDCIELYRHNTRARHRLLFRFNTWADVEKHHHNNKGFQRINRMLEKNFHTQDWEKTRSKFKQRGDGKLALVLIEHTLNFEFSNVMLTPDMFNDSRTEKFDEFCKKLYVGVTRPTRTLIAPEELRNWIEDQQ